MNVTNHEVRFLHPAVPIRVFWLSLLLVLVTSGASQLHGAPTAWQRHAFPLPDSIWSVEAFDANADGLIDIIAMGQSQVFALTAPDWKVHVLVDVHEPKMLYCAALDADGDGDLDLAVGRYRFPGSLIARRSLMARK